MKSIPFFTILFVGLLVTFSARAALDIVESHSGVIPLWILKDTASGKVLGTFWNYDARTSDFGYEGHDGGLTTLWSKDRSYVAVNGGEARSQSVFLYKVEVDTLKQIEVPALTEEQAAPINALSDPVADGAEALRWQDDGRLLLHFWAAKRETSNIEKQKTADVWADLEVKGAEARIIRTSSQEITPLQVDDPSAFDPKGLVGIHEVTGRNPDGTKYSGKIEVRVKKGLILMEWRIGKQVSHGTGVLVGMTLGVALDNGLALYKIVGQAEGVSLIGFWSGSGSTLVNEEAILIGNADMTQAKFPLEKINGNYLSLREIGDAQDEGKVTISGGDVGKKVLWKIHGNASKCQGLSLGDGLAVISPDGLSVFENHESSTSSASFEGRTVSENGTISQDSLIPAN